MGLVTILVTELAKNVPAIIIASVAAASIWLNAKTLTKRFLGAEAQLATLTHTTAHLPAAFERLAAAERDLIALRQEQHDQNLMARQYVTRSELIESIGSTGQKVHRRVDAVEIALARLDERTTK